MRVHTTCAFLSVVVLALSGCGGHVYRIRDIDRRTLEGVPFFARVGVCRQETAYVQPVYRVAVQVLSGTREIALFESSITGRALVSPEMTTLRREVGAPGADPARIGAAFDALTRDARYRYDPLAAPSATDLFMASNTIVSESQVDYARPLFLNVSRPWIGSASADARLAADGTLTQAGGEIKDTTPETILGLLPAKEMLTAIASGKALGAILGAPAADSGTLQLVIDPEYVKHTYAKLGPTPCPADANPIAPGASDAMYRREQLKEQVKE